MNRLMNAIEGINDMHIIEFADPSPYKKRSHHSIRFVAAAACFFLMVTAIPTVMVLSKKAADNISSDPHAYPCVVINGKKYFYDDYTPLMELPDGYAAIGSVLSNDPVDKEKEGYSLGCKVGDIIYQDPGDTSEIFVYTKLFKGNGYWFIRFVQFPRQVR